MSRTPQQFFSLAFLWSSLKNHHDFILQNSFPSAFEFFSSMLWKKL
jgi:hypothetical protein